MSGGKEWTTSEVRILREIHESGFCVKDQMHLLAGRTYNSVKIQMSRLGLPPKKRGKVLVSAPFSTKKGQAQLTKFLGLLEQFGPQTVTQIGARMHLCPSAVYRIIQHAHERVEPKLIHVHDFSETATQSKYSIRLWALGDFPDAVSTARVVREKRTQRKQKERISQQEYMAQHYSPRRDPAVEALFGRAA